VRGAASPPAGRSSERADGVGAELIGPRRTTRAPLPRLHVVTDDRVLAREGWTRAAAGVLAAGGAALALHVRGPRTGGATLFELARALLPEARGSGALLIVNDRVDVALVAGTDGAHLGRRSLPVREARSLLGHAWLGASVHEPEAAGPVRSEGADYAFLGTMFRTPTHPDATGLGPDALARAAGGAVGFPVLAIGGIGPRRVGAVRAAGAYGVAVVSGVWDAGDPASAVARYLEELMKAEAEPARGSTR